MNHRIVLLLLRARIRELTHPLRSWQNVGVLVFSLLVVGAFAPALVMGIWASLGRLTALGAASTLAYALIALTVFTWLRGWQIIARRLGRDPASEPWLVLGGSWRVLVLGDLARFAASASAVFGLAVPVLWPLGARLAGGREAFGLLVGCGLVLSLLLWTTAALFSTRIARGRPRVGWIGLALLVVVAVALAPLLPWSDGLLLLVQWIDTSTRGSAGSALMALSLAFAGAMAAYLGPHPGRGRRAGS